MILITTINGKRERLSQESGRLPLEWTSPFKFKDNAEKEIESAKLTLQALDRPEFKVYLLVDQEMLEADGVEGYLLVTLQMIGCKCARYVIEDFKTRSRLSQLSYDKYYVTAQNGVLIIYERNF